jgi:hypothetical protein
MPDPLPLLSWARLRIHGPCHIFDWHASESDARDRIDLDATKLGDQVYKFQTVAYFPDRAPVQMVVDDALGVKLSDILQPMIDRTGVLG